MEINAFFKAVQEEQEQIVREGLEEGIDIEVKGENGNTPLYTAVGTNNISIVQLLLEKKANISYFNPKGGSTPLALAVYLGYTEIVKLMLEGNQNININGTEGSNENTTLLYIAARENRPEIAKLLIEKGAEIDISNMYRMTPLHIAAYTGHSDIIELLIKKGANLDARNIRNVTAEQIALEENHEVIAQLLSSASAKQKSQINNHGLFAPKSSSSTQPDLSANTDSRKACCIIC